MIKGCWKRISSTWFLMAHANFVAGFGQIIINILWSKVYQITCPCRFESNFLHVPSVTCFVVTKLQFCSFSITSTIRCSWDMYKWERKIVLKCVHWYAIIFVFSVIALITCRFGCALVDDPTCFSVDKKMTACVVFGVYSAQSRLMEPAYHLRTVVVEK